MAQVRVEVLTGPPGCGKSHRMREEAVRSPGRYLFFAPTIPLIHEQVSRFREDAQREGKNIALFEAHSGRKGRPVQYWLDEAIEAIEAGNSQHAVVLTTHDALMTRDLSRFAGWHARIDEAPNSARSGKVNIGQTWQWFDARFNLSPVGDTGWSSVHLKGAAPSWPEINQDALLKPLRDFIKLTDSPSGVLVQTTAWKGVKSLKWWSIWVPTALRDFATIKVAGASYHTSLGALVTRRMFGDEVEFADVPVPMARAPGPRTVSIHFFTRTHEPTSSFWDESEGRRMLKQVADYLEHQVPSLGFWSGNVEVLKLLEWRARGDSILPKVLGQNKWRDQTSCAFIYSSGPTPEDEPLQLKFGITDEEIRIAREDEDILQFAMRGALRNRDFEGTYDIYLYTEEQAKRLGQRLEASNVGTVRLVPVVEAGILDASVGSRAAHRAKSRKTSTAATDLVLNPKTGRMVQSKSLSRAVQRERKNPAPRPRGRPRKDAGRPSD